MSDNQTPGSIEMAGVREYGEELPVCLLQAKGRAVVEAANEGGHCGTTVDLVDLLAWVLINRPELLEEAQQQADRQQEPNP